MQSENTSKKTRKVTPKKAVAVAETTKAEPLKTARTTKSSATKSATAGKRSSSPKHHHSSNPEKISAPIAATITVVRSEELIVKKDMRQEVARLAHSYWEARNFTHGHADEDWLRAERELSLTR